MAGCPVYKPGRTAMTCKPSLPLFLAPAAPSRQRGVPGQGRARFYMAWQLARVLRRYPGVQSDNVQRSLVMAGLDPFEALSWARTAVYLLDGRS
jgi:hypothetical protein